jgi:hypothetical protein
VREYFALSTRALELVSIRRPDIVMSVYPWICESAKVMSELIRAVDDSPFDSILVVDAQVGKPMFTLTANVEAVKKCKRGDPGPTNDQIFACEQTCKAQNPNCTVLIIIVTSKGCSCVCDSQDLPNIQGGDFWEQHGGR